MPGAVVRQFDTAGAMLPQLARLDRLIERALDDHAGLPARRHAQPRHRDREQVKNRVPVAGYRASVRPPDTGPTCLLQVLW
jgi:hypothetical protein